MPASDAGGGTGKSLTWSNLTREEEKPQHEREDCAHPEDSDVSDRPPAIASENSRQPRVRGGEKSVTSAAHVAAITTTRARRRNRRLVIPVAPGVHLGGLPGGLWRVPLASPPDAFRLEVPSSAQQRKERHRSHGYLCAAAE